MFTPDPNFPPKDDVPECDKTIRRRSDIGDPATHGPTMSGEALHLDETPGPSTTDNGTSLTTSNRALHAVFGLSPGDRTFAGVKRPIDQGPSSGTADKPMAKKGRVVVTKNMKALLPVQSVGAHAPPLDQVSDGRPRRNRKRPSKYIDHVPPLENKPRGEMGDPLTPKKAVWVLHPEHPNQTIALGQSGPHWCSTKKKSFLT
ncbi:hypothetical protein M758_UG224400 [Ceratodon purpureus]|nr:hypothetical protein M758_UG224400 [Ceratodon purpureus]